MPAITHPVHKALNRPQTLLWIDKRACLYCIMAAFVCNWLSSSFLYGVGSFIVFHITCYLLIGRDPALLPIRYRAWRQHQYYCCIKYVPLKLEIIHNAKNQ